MENKNNITIGLTGNPNVGKTTFFNTLTGSRQHVGNWPGKTVEKKEGEIVVHGKKINLVDLPGAYSMTAYSEEETVTADFILKEKPDIVVQIVDAQNMARNLFMTIQLLELGAPLVIILNMVELAKKDGITIDIDVLATLLGVPVFLVDARDKKSSRKLIEKIIEESLEINKTKTKLNYSTEVNEELDKLKKIISSHDDLADKEIDWLSIKLLEGDYRAEQYLSRKDYVFEIKEQLAKSIYHLDNIYGQDINTILANVRFGFIKGLEKDVVKRKRTKSKRFVEKLDNFVTNRFLGIPIFLVVIWMVFQATFAFSEPLVDWIESLIGILSEYLSSLLVQAGASDLMVSFVNDGIIGGVGGVLVFVPIIAVMFLMITLLEDSGYMSRVAYVMDGLMHKIGLHGKAFIPLILGFGCNVPGIMATRTLEKKEDRLLTILINPLMSCGARLPVYALFAGVFFSAYQGWIIFSLYLLGVLLAIVAGLVFKRFLFRGLTSPFVIELPPYRWPTLKGVVIHVWERVWLFVKKAGTIILAFSLLVWVLASFPVGVEYGSKESLAGSIGQGIAPIFEPLGFGNWQSSVALMFGVVAKEIVIGTFGTLYGVDQGDELEGDAFMNSDFSNDFTPLSAYAFMVFVLLYIPCMATVAVIKRETNSWRWPLFVISYTTVLAWGMAFVIYQGGLLLGFS